MGEWAPATADAVRAYLRDGSIEGRPAQSLRTYRAHLSLLRDCPCPLTSIDLRDRLHRRILSLSPNSAAHSISVHRSFVAYCLTQGWLQRDPLLGIKPPRRREVPHEWLTADDARTLYAACTCELDRAALVLLTLGLRASEACGVRWTDIGSDPDGAYLSVRTAKGGPHRMVPLAPRALEVIEAMPRRCDRVLGIGSVQLWRRMHALGEKAGVRFHPHMARHGYGMAMIEEVDQGVVQTLMGHADASMTRWYSRSALERVALRKAREVDLSARLFGNAPESRQGPILGE